MSTEVYKVYEMYEVEDELGCLIGVYSSLEAAKQAIALFILWRMSMGEIDDWHPEEAPWGRTLVPAAEEWDGDPASFEWKAAEDWIARHGLRDLVNWYVAENPGNILFIEPIHVRESVPPANRQGALSVEPETFPLFSGNWRGRPNIIQEILVD